MPAHGEKRHIMVPAGQLMAKNDNSWEYAQRAVMGTINDLTD